MMGTSALRRVGAMILRQVYVLRRSWPRLLELAYWPTMQLVLWGSVSYTHLTLPTKRIV